MSSYQWDFFKKASTGMNIDASSFLTFLTSINMKHSARWGGDVEAGTAAGEWHSAAPKTKPRDEKTTASSLPSTRRPLPCVCVCCVSVCEVDAVVLVCLQRPLSHMIPAFFINCPLSISWLHCRQSTTTRDRNCAEHRIGSLIV